MFGTRQYKMQFVLSPPEGDAKGLPTALII